MLQKQTVPITFQGGLSSKTDALQVPIAKCNFLWKMLF